MRSEPPHDEVAEQSVLGAMLLSPGAITEVSQLLSADHFFKPQHGMVFAAMLALSNEGEPVDAVTVGRELEKRNVLKKVGGLPYLHTLLAAVPTATAANAYARVVFDKYRQRRIIDAGTRFIELGNTPAADSSDVDNLLAQADAVMRDLGQPSRKGMDWDALILKWRNWQDADHGVVATPWDELNAWLHGGIHRGQLIVVGGRPGGGKSNAGLNMALEAAEKKHKCTVFSVEMDDVEVAARLLAAGSWSKVGQIFSRRMDAETMQRVDSYISAHHGMPLEVVDQAYITVEQIIAHCRARRPEVIFVDYAQLLQASDSRVPREQQVAHVSRSLKVAAKELSMAVIVAAQLNRGPTGKDGREPLISDLRESGAVEQDADVVLLLHRSDANGEGKVNLIVGKNRNGPTGNIQLMFRGGLARIG